MSDSSSRTPTFPENHPILKQAIDDAIQFSWRQIGVPALGAMANLIVTLIGEYKAGRLNGWPNAKTFVYSLLWSLVVGAILYGLIAVIRAPFVVIGRQHRELAGIKEELITIKTSNITTLTPTSSQLVPLESPQDPPNIVYQPLNQVLMPAHVDDDGFIVEGFYENPPYATWVSAEEIEQRNRLALVAYYENQPTDRKVGPIDGISARLTYQDEEIDDIKQPKVNRGAWLTSRASAVRFGVNDRHLLILALLSQEGETLIVTTAERTVNGDRGQRILGSPVIVVQLVAEKEGKILTAFKHKITLKNGESTVEILG